MAPTNLRQAEELLNEEANGLIAEFDTFIAKEVRNEDDLERMSGIETRMDTIRREKDHLATRREWERTEAEVIPTSRDIQDPFEPDKMPTPYRGSVSA